MQEIAKIMKEYFDAEGSPIRTPVEDHLFSPGLLLVQEVPLKATKAKWEVVDGPERFVRVFSFKERYRLIDFVNEVLKFEDEMKHHGELKISDDKIQIGVYTHTVERITELDREYIRHVDRIYQDVLHYGYDEAKKWI